MDGTLIGDRLHSVLEAHHAEYTEVLAAHIGRHLAPFAAAAQERTVAEGIGVA